MTEWIYVTEDDNVRYALGTSGENTLICIGINPSTASPDKLDPTLKSVERITYNNGYDSYLMINIYPVRCTEFKKLNMNECRYYHKRNLEEITKLLRQLEQPYNIWLAYGNLIEEEKHMKKYLKDILKELAKYKCNYYCTGLTKKANPRHPLYQKSTTKLEEYKIKE